MVHSADAERGDRVVIRLISGGGSVTGYGLATAQLLRLKAAGLHLTICVEQVAASGGYMMACVADEIIASPFAVLGSIGVITQVCAGAVLRAVAGGRVRTPPCCWHADATCSSPPDPHPAPYTCLSGAPQAATWHPDALCCDGILAHVAS